MYRKCGTDFLIVVKDPIKRGSEMAPEQAQEHRILVMKLQDPVSPQYSRAPSLNLEFLQFESLVSVIRHALDHADGRGDTLHITSISSTCHFTGLVIIMTCFTSCRCVYTPVNVLGKWGTGIRLV